jgi:hypothetical protein
VPDAQSWQTSAVRQILSSLGLQHLRRSRGRTATQLRQTGDRQMTVDIQQTVQRGRYRRC